MCVCMTKKEAETETGTDRHLVCPFLFSLFYLHFVNPGKVALHFRDSFLHSIKGKGDTSECGIAQHCWVERIGSQDKSVREMQSGAMVITAQTI